jgi:hypothetical protein
MSTSSTTPTRHHMHYLRARVWEEDMISSGRGVLRGKQSVVHDCRASLYIRMSCNGMRVVVVAFAGYNCVDTDRTRKCNEHISSCPYAFYSSYSAIPPTDSNVWASSLLSIFHVRHARFEAFVIILKITGGVFLSNIFSSQADQRRGDRASCSPPIAQRRRSSPIPTIPAAMR